MSQASHGQPTLDETSWPELPRLKVLWLVKDQITDQGVASLLAPPTAGVLPSLEHLILINNQITDEGCAALASALRGGALPALKELGLFRPFPWGAAVPPGRCACFSDWMVRMLF